MLPSDKQMVLNVEYNLSPVSVSTASGNEILLYTVVVTKDVDVARELCLIHLPLSHFLQNLQDIF